MTTATTAPPTIEEATKARDEAVALYQKLKAAPDAAREFAREARQEAADARQEAQEARTRGDVEFNYGDARQRAERLEAEADEAEEAIGDAEAKADAALVRLRRARADLNEARIGEEYVPRAAEVGDRIREALQELHTATEEFDTLAGQHRVAYEGVRRDRVERNGEPGSVLRGIVASAHQAAGLHVNHTRDLKELAGKARVLSQLMEISR